jgi:transposase
LTLEFCEIVRKRKADEFDDWLIRAENSDMTPLINFTAGIRNDYDAIKNACTLEWSNGQVEGQVNRLKNIKRQMYGRCSFELLKKMVLQDSG